MNVCFFPRLKEFILNQDWNDPKSQLQQCCLTLRTEGKEPDIPLYKTLQTVGPSHARTYTVAVYFKGERIGCGKGPSIQQAEMGAAMDALEKCKRFS
ncbi:ribonuclease 3-like [Chrysemys picta bellii]